VAPGELSVADEVSRGIPAQELTGRWKDGPEFLKLAEEQWPKETWPTTDQTNEDQAERRKPRTVLHVANRDQVEVIVCKKFSSWRKLLRITAYVRRFVQNLQALRKMRRMKDTPDIIIQLGLGPLYMKKSEAYWTVGRVINVYPGEYET
jgi:rhamnose utilization protein RhaD (predicted bifunctional aldolase and dehydrogenase)